MSNLIIHANKFLFVRNDAANAFQMRTSFLCDTESIHLHTLCGAQWWHFIEHLRKTMEMDTLFCFSLRLSFGILCGLLTHFPSMSTIQFRAEWHTVHQFTAFVLKVQNHVKQLFQRSTICVQILHVPSDSVWWLSPEKKT